MYQFDWFDTLSPGSQQSTNHNQFYLTSWFHNQELVHATHYTTKRHEFRGIRHHNGKDIIYPYRTRSDGFEYDVLSQFFIEDSITETDESGNPITSKILREDENGRFNRIFLDEIFSKFQRENDLTLIGATDESTMVPDGLVQSSYYPDYNGDQSNMGPCISDNFCFVEALDYVRDSYLSPKNA